MNHFFKRLDSVLFESENPKPIIVDQYDQIKAMKALYKTRGPCVGWDDYVAGKDYQPPYVFDTADKASEFKSRTGTKYIKSPAVPIGPADKGDNPHAKKYGGVRPWSPNEVLTVLMNVSKVPEKKGLIQLIASKSSIRTAMEKVGRFDGVEDLIDIGAEAALTALRKDGGVPGVKFTSFIGTAIEEAIRSGSSAGYGNEYRHARGILEKIGAAVRKAATAYGKAESKAAKETDEAKKTALMDAARSAANASIKAVQKLTSAIDPEPGPNNKYGYLVNDILSTSERAMAALESGNRQEIEKAVKLVFSVKEEVADNEDIYRTRGVSTDTLISKAKDRPALHVGGLSAPGEGGKEVEVTNYHSKDKMPGVSSGGRWSFNYKNSDGSNSSKLIEDPIGFLQDALGYDYDGAKELVANQQDVKVPESDNFGGGKLSFNRTDAGSEYSTASDSIRNNPEIVEMLGQLASLARKGHGQGPVWHASNAGRAMDMFKSVMSDDRSSSNNYKIVPIKASYDIRNNGDEFDIVDDSGDVIDTEVTKTAARNKIYELSQTARGYSIVDANSGKSVGVYDDQAEANEMLSNMSESQHVATVNNILKRANNKDYGEYLEDVLEIGKMVLGYLRYNDQGMLEDIDERISVIKHLVAEDLESKEGMVSPGTFSTQQYRYLLRMYGIDNYPEKGTVEDPEIDENGELSNWAKSGYPAIADNGTIATDLGFTAARASQLKAKINKMLPELVKQISHEINESLNMIDKMIISELHLKLCGVLREQIILDMEKSRTLTERADLQNTDGVPQPTNLDAGFYGVCVSKCKRDPQKVWDGVFRMVRQKFNASDAFVSYVLNGPIGGRLGLEMINPDGSIDSRLPDSFKIYIGQLMKNAA